jgi:hypothetical protein
MRTINALIGIALCCAANPALADFQLLSARQPAEHPISILPAAPILRIQHPEPVISKALSHAAAARPRFSTARGFGQRIPLSFAIRQIVPFYMKVTFGPNVDPNALVNWQGGRSWNTVLRDTVRPLGLYVTIHHGGLTIAN